MKTFLLLYEAEFEPENWKNPKRKVKPPKVNLEPLETVKLEDITEILKHSNPRDFCILVCMLDTGARASEFLNMNISEVNLLNGEILIRQGKGRKPRTVYLCAKSRKALRSYLKQRMDNNPALWVIDEGTRLKYTGLRMMFKRRATQAKVPTPAIHSFMRAFALNIFHSGLVSPVTLANMLGHYSLSVLHRYIKQTYDDGSLAHKCFQPSIMDCKNKVLTTIKSLTYYGCKI